MKIIHSGKCGSDAESDRNLASKHCDEDESDI